MKLAAQLYTVRAHTQTEKGIFEVLKKVRSIGYTSVQISAFGAFDPSRLKAELDASGLTACATHTPLERILNDTQSVINEHKLLGIKYVGLGWYKCGDLAGCKKLLSDLRYATDAFCDAGLMFLYHNHAHEFIKFNGVCPLDYMRDNTDPKKFGFLPDLYWAQTAGLSPTKLIADYSGRIPVVHFKDMRAPLPEKSNMAEIFEGNMDYAAIYRACLKAGAEYAAVEQDTCDGDPFESLRVSYENIKRHNLFTEQK